MFREAVTETDEWVFHDEWTEGWFGAAYFGLEVHLHARFTLDDDVETVLSGALAISAGTFLYIASSDLLPHLHRKMKEEWVNFIAFLFGIFILSLEAVHHLFG